MIVLNVIGPAILAGILHVILGPDHIAAIMTVSACQGSSAVWYGIRWGVGHSFGLILVALVIWAIDSDSNISKAAFAKYASYFSGVFMILFGLYFVRDVLLNRKSKRGFSVVGTTELAEITPPIEEEERTSLSPSHAPEHEKQSEAPNRTLYQAFASLCAGIVGGVAGPGGVLAIVPASYYQTRMEAVMYIMCFIVASTACMGLFAYIYGRVTTVDSKHQETKLKLVSAIASILVGCIWIILTALNVIDSLHYV